MTLLKSYILAVATVVLVLVLHHSDRAFASGLILSSRLGPTADINAAHEVMSGVTKVAAGRRSRRVAGPGIRRTRRGIGPGIRRTRRGIGPGIRQTRRGVRPGTRRTRRGVRRFRRSRVFGGFFPYSSNGGYYRYGYRCHFLADCPCRYLAGC